MKYKRLTKRIAKDEEAFLFHSGLHEGIERLAELEDKIEGGTLIELPVNVWDTIYCIRNWGKGRYEIEEHVVTEIVFEYNNQMRIKTSCGLFGCEKWTFGLDCFADNTEAEAQLKELQGRKC